MSRLSFNVRMPQTPDWERRPKIRIFLLACLRATQLGGAVGMLLFNLIMLRFSARGLITLAAILIPWAIVIALVILLHRLALELQ